MKLSIPWYPLSVVVVLAFLSTLGSCGYADGGGGRIIGQPLVGGVFLPGKLTYGSLDMAGAPADEEDLPSQVDLRRDGVVPPIQNQRWNNCVGWALGYYVMSGLEMRHYREHYFFAGNLLNPADPENWFSPDYVYGQRELDTDTIIDRAPHLRNTAFCREADGLLGCMRPEVAIARLSRVGCCRWPFMCAGESDARFRACGGEELSPAATGSRAPWAFAEPNGYWFRPRCFVRFGVLSEPGGSARVSPVHEMQRWLHEEGTPIAVVVEMKSGWISYRGERRVQAPVLFRGRNDGLTEERGVCLDAGGTSLGSQHMMTIIGYDRAFLRDPVTNPAGAVLLANQWGTKWGHDGYMWLPVAELEKIWIGGYGLVKWIPGAGVAPRGGATVCAPDESGKFIELSDLNDVPRNVVKSDCEDVCQYHYDLTASPLSLEGGHVEVEDRVGSVQGRSVDVADWFVLPAATSGQIIDCTAVSTVSGPRGPVVHLKVTDADLRPLGVFCPRTGVTTATLGTGEHFIKVEPSYGGPYEASLAGAAGADYTLSVTLRNTPLEDEACEVVAAAPEARPLVFAQTTVTLAPGSWQAYRYDRLGKLEQEDQIHPRIRVTGLSGDQEAEVVVAGPVPWWHLQQPLPGFRDFEVCRVDADGLDLPLRPMTGSPEHRSKNEWEPFVAIRNLTALPFDVTLAISIHPPAGEVNNEEPEDPGIAAVLPEQWPGWWRPAEGGRANGFRVSAPGFVSANHWGSEVFELQHASASAQMVLTDAGGNPLGGSAELADMSLGGDAALRPPGVLRKVLRVPTGWNQEVWVEAYEDDQTTPLRNLRLRRYNTNTLARWPMSGELPLAPREEDDAPARATVLQAGQSPDNSIGFGIFKGSRLSWDFFDYYLIENHEAVPRVPRLTVVKPDPCGEGGPGFCGDANLHVMRWQGGAPDTPRQETLVAKGVPQLSFPALAPGAALDAGATVLILVYSGTQAWTPYRLELSWQ